MVGPLISISGYIFFIPRVACPGKSSTKNFLRGEALMAQTQSRGVYAISVAAELTGAGVQNLRVYERHGLVEPDRTDGGTRRYSEDDLARITRVLSLLEKGLNLAGVALVLRLEDDNARLRELAGEKADR
jgi:MerR family transcriptional regulator/heat shock protein HspR